jgi:fructokinase
MAGPLRIGIDLGGSKIAAIALRHGKPTALPLRIATPRHDYDGAIAAIAGLVVRLEETHRETGSVGVGMPGSLSPATGLVQNANSTWLNGRPFGADLEARLGRPLRLANDANCLALSEAFDGAGHGATTVFGVILGTGCGGGIVINARALAGRHAIAGEWGHNPLPWMTADEHPGPSCWCGRLGCLETFVSGPALERQFAGKSGETLGAAAIAARAAGGDGTAIEVLDLHAGRLARGLAQVVNLIDPEVIVLGGGLSNLAHLYEALPRLMAPNIFADHPRPDIRPPRHGDISGVRGAARLWDDEHWPAPPRSR